VNNSGYSHKPLVDKLGYKLDQTVYVYNAPQFFTTYLKKEFRDPVDRLPADWGHFFFMQVPDFKSFLSNTEVEKIVCGFWVSWVKNQAILKQI
jgi:hypothetical protein